MEAVNMIGASLQDEEPIIVNRFHMESAEQIPAGGSTVSGQHGDRGKPQDVRQMVSRDDRKKLYKKIINFLQPLGIQFVLSENKV